MPETERLWVREAVTGVEETEEEEALLEPEPIPDVSREESEVHSQNWGGRRDKHRLQHLHPERKGGVSPNRTPRARRGGGVLLKGVTATAGGAGNSQ